MPSTSLWPWFLLCSTAISGAACAQILGNDFCRSDEADCPTTSSTTNTGGTGAVGGAGGTGGGVGGDAGGGGTAPALLDCALVAGTHAEVASLEAAGSNQQWNTDQMWVVGLNDDDIFIVMTRLDSQPVIEVFEVGQTGLRASADGDGVFDVHPIGNGIVGVLFSNANNLMFWRTSGTLTETVSSQNMLPTTIDTARFTLVPGGKFGIVASGDDDSDARALFGIYESSPINLTRFTESDVNLSGEDVRPSGFVRQASVNHVFLGDGSIGSAGRYHAFDDASVTEQAPTQVFPDGLQMVTAVAASGSTAALALRDANVGVGFTIRYGLVPFDDLATTVVDTLPITVELTNEQVPADSEPLVTDTHTTLAGSVVGDPGKASLLVLGFADGIQATGTLDILAEIPGADAIDSIRARPRDGFPVNPQIDLVVTTSHGSGSYKKLHTFEVVCSAP